jgi:hypothetical protein
VTGKEVQKELIDLGIPRCQFYAEIGKRAGFHASQCSHAVNGSGKRSDDEREKILKEAEKIIQELKDDATKKKTAP